LDRGAIRIRLGELDQAESDFNKAIQLNPKIAAGYRYCGFLKGAKGDLAGALADYDTAVKLDGLDALGYHGRAVIKLASADLDGALTDLQTSIERSQTDRQRFYDQIHLWIVLADLKRAAEANQGLTDYLQNRNLTNAEPWMTAIAEFLLDKSDEAALLAAAKRGYNEVAIRGQTAEAFFFAGLKRRLAGAELKKR
jgi:lipoprotein NlpI